MLRKVERKIFLREIQILKEVHSNSKWSIRTASRQFVMYISNFLQLIEEHGLNQFNAKTLQFYLAVNQMYTIRFESTQK